jgi:hypothetical protein
MQSPNKSACITRDIQTGELNTGSTTGKLSTGICAPASNQTVHSPLGSSSTRPSHIVLSFGIYDYVQVHFISRRLNSLHTGLLQFGTKVWADHGCFTGL